MKKLFLSLCLFLAISTVFAQTFVPDPNKVYNIVESTSNNVIGANGTQPALTDKLLDLASQAFHFVSTGETDTYYILNGDSKYLNKVSTNGYDTRFADTISVVGNNSKWVIVGADAISGIRLMMVNNSKYLSSDGTSYGSTLYCDKPVDHSNGLYKLQVATIYTGTTTTLYNETFSPTGVDVNADWTGKPSTLAGGNKWSAGIDLQTEGDGNMNLVSQWSNLRLKLTSADAAVIIPDVNVAGYTNLLFSIDGYREDAPLAPILYVKVDAGDWVLQTTQGVGNWWNWTTALTSIKDASGVQLSNVSTISLKISNTNTGTATYLLDNVKILGRSISTSLSNISKDVFSVYPNPTTNYILIKNAQKVIVLDLNGRIVKEAINTEKVDISSLVKGAYIVKVKIDNATKIGKFIKE